MSAAESIVWIDWGRHLRTHTLSRRLGVDLVEIRHSRSRIWRYVRSTLDTVAAIRRLRPAVVIATNPSIVLGYFLLILRPWYGFRLVSDAHYVGVTAIPRRLAIQRLLDVHNTQVDLVVVTNENQARALQGLGASTYVCPDPLPQLPKPVAPPEPLPLKSVFLICSFDVDEPYEEAFEAFSELQSQGFVLFVCGNYRKAGIQEAQFPWVRFLGFVPDADYYAYLRASSVVVDLTTLEDCLVCGAYEALAARRPLVVSKTGTLGDYFGAASVLTENTSAAIQQSVLEAFARREELSRKADDWVRSNELFMTERIGGLRAELIALCSRAEAAVAR
jgi:glycosyltransferase involved in cell wall biosynthesis